MKKVTGVGGILFKCKDPNKMKELKKEGVTLVDEIEEYDFGKFIHIIDIEGNKVELWEPKD